MKSFLNKKMVIATTLLFVSLSIRSNIFAVDQSDIEREADETSIKFLRRSGYTMATISAIGVLLAARDKESCTSLIQSYMLHANFFSIGLTNMADVKMSKGLVDKDWITSLPIFLFLAELIITGFPKTTMTPIRLRMLRVARGITFISMASSLFLYSTVFNMAAEDRKSVV